jgi:hypothetical protein
MLVEKTMTVADLQSVIDLPWEGNQEVEIFIFPLNKNGKNNISDLKKSDLEKIKSAQGILSKYANPDLIPLEKEAWAMHCEEKYGNP